MTPPSPKSWPVRSVLPSELRNLQHLEVAAASRFVDVGLPDVAIDAPIPVEVLERYRRDGRAWVATAPSDVPVGFVLADQLDGSGHIAELSVHPAWGRRGIGRALIERVAAWAGTRRLATLTLTTFAGVAWNAPFYRSQGFIAMDDAELGPELGAIRTQERESGTDRPPRLAMIRHL